MQPSAAAAAVPREGPSARRQRAVLVQAKGNCFKSKGERERLWRWEGPLQDAKASELLAALSEGSRSWSLMRDGGASPVMTVHKAACFSVCNTLLCELAVERQRCSSGAGLEMFVPHETPPALQEAVRAFLCVTEAHFCTTLLTGVGCQHEM
jgi:hypothetical protein